jgi:A/G-specific adenine glycosylase
MRAVPPPGWFARNLLTWFAQHGRKNLPWQVNPSAYRVWVSEVMLQQTQVATVIGYFERFMQRFPTVQALAEAPLDEVLHLWTGLGYYARARNLHAAAKMIAAKGPGMDAPATRAPAGIPEEFPTTQDAMSLDALMRLPGIGRSTAAAILALALGQRHAILDGNVRRVLARVFGVAGDPGTSSVTMRLWDIAESCTPHNEVAAYTQAIMDLGAMVCTRSQPSCHACPMSEYCVAMREGRQSELPGPKAKRDRASREAVLLIAEAHRNGSSAVLLERRPARGVWGGLWSLPQFDSESAALDWCRREFGDTTVAVDQLPAFDHAFTHFDLRLKPVRVHCSPVQRDAVHEVSDEGRLWYQLQAPARVGLPQPIAKLIERIRTQRESSVR